MNTDTKQWPDLASRSLGAGVIYANDELFADRENLIKPDDPVVQPHTFGNKGQIMDGWETRRRREPGSDSAIVRLGCAGVLRRIVVDTSYFTGNYPPEVSVEACGAEGYPPPAELTAAEWTALVPRTAVAGDARNEFDVTVDQRFTHVRLTIFPDGGVARLRVHGEPVPDPRLLTVTARTRIIHITKKSFCITRDSGAHHGHHLRRQSVRQGGGPPGPRHPRR